MHLAGHGDNGYGESDWAGFALRRGVVRRAHLSVTASICSVDRAAYRKFWLYLQLKPSITPWCVAVPGRSEFLNYVKIWHGHR